MHGGSKPKGKIYLTILTNYLRWLTAGVIFRGHSLIDNTPIHIHSWRILTKYRRRATKNSIFIIPFLITLLVVWLRKSFRTSNLWTDLNVPRWLKTTSSLRCSCWWYPEHVTYCCSMMLFRRCTTMNIIFLCWCILFRVRCQSDYEICYLNYWCCFIFVNDLYCLHWLISSKLIQKISYTYITK